jgi:hypothetical protein
MHRPRNDSYLAPLNLTSGVMSWQCDKFEVALIITISLCVVIESMSCNIKVPKISCDGTYNEYNYGITDLPITSYRYYYRSLTIVIASLLFFLIISKRYFEKFGQFNVTNTTDGVVDQEIIVVQEVHIHTYIANKWGDPSDPSLCNGHE